MKITNCQWQGKVRRGWIRVTFTKPLVPFLLLPLGSRVADPQPTMAVNAAQHTIINLLKALWDAFVIMCHKVFNVWPKTTLLLPAWPRDAKRLDTPIVGPSPFGTDTMILRYEAHFQLGPRAKQEHTKLGMQSHFRHWNQWKNKYANTVSGS